MDDQNPNPTVRMDTPTPAAQPDPDSTSFGAPADPPPPEPMPATSATFGEPATPPSYVPPALPPEAPPPAQPAAPGAGFPLVPAQSSWSQPRPRDRGGRMWSVIAGLGLLALGLWFFADRTLGLDMPDLRWSQLWPVILIGIGLIILWGALRRERR